MLYVQIWDRLGVKEPGVPNRKSFAPNHWHNVSRNQVSFVQTTEFCHLFIDQAASVRGKSPPVWIQWLLGQNVTGKSCKRSRNCSITLNKNNNLENNPLMCGGEGEHTDLWLPAVVWPNIPALPNPSLRAAQIGSVRAIQLLLPRLCAGGSSNSAGQINLKITFCNWDELTKEAWIGQRGEWEEEGGGRGDKREYCYVKHCWSLDLRSLGMSCVWG